MRAILLITLVNIAVVLAPGYPSAQAGVWIHSGITLTRAREGGQVGLRYLTSNTIGYAFWQGFVVGAQGLTRRSSPEDQMSFAIGPKGGLLLSGFELTAAYLPYAKETLPGRTRTGGGFALNAGYTFPLFRPVRLGLNLTLWSMTFRKENGEPLRDRPQVSYLSPQLAIGFEF